MSLASWPLGKDPPWTLLGSLQLAPNLLKRQARAVVEFRSIRDRSQVVGVRGDFGGEQHREQCRIAGARGGDGFVSEDDRPAQRDDPGEESLGLAGLADVGAKRDEPIMNGHVVAFPRGHGRVPYAHVLESHLAHPM